MIIVYHPSKVTLRYGDETKSMADVQAGPQLGQPGHYFSCSHCGNSGPIRTGDGSRTRAVLDAHGHACSYTNQEAS